MDFANSKILIIEDEPDIIEFLVYNLEREGFKALTARDGQLGLKEAVSKQPSLILLDLMLPGMSGMEICRMLRQKAETRNIPVIMLTAKGEESDKVLGLELGADDYVTKPFSPKELIARIRAVLRRSAEELGVLPDTPRIELGPLRIDPDRHEVRVADKLIEMTAAEFRLLQALASRPGRVFTRQQLLEKVTGGDTVVLDRNVDVHIGAIRRKLGRRAEGLISTVRGVGYKFKEV